MPRFSLNQRIILGAVIVLVFFITLTATALNKAFIKNSENALKDTLSTQLYALMASAEVDFIDNRSIFSMPGEDLASLFGLPNSGLYAQVIDPSSRSVWQSESYISSSAAKAYFLKSGEQLLTKIMFKNKQFYQLSYGINWLVGEREVPLTFIINQDLSTYNEQLNDYSNTLWFWLGGMAAFLILSQILILKWGLSPIALVVDELQKIETGQQQKIERHYPKEIEYLSNNINHLLDHEHAQKKRYRNALDDLAHSLKTPLAILQSTISNDKGSAEQISRMNSIVEYQLQKASTAGVHNLNKAIDIKLLLDRIIASLNKVYHDKNIAINVASDTPLYFKADEGDMMELFGNLLDNACKWTSSDIHINARLNKQSLNISIEDNGPGFPPALIEQLKIRGRRADTNTPGHGIGLSVVNNIVDSYTGTISIKNNAPKQGATISISL